MSSKHIPRKWKGKHQGKEPSAYDREAIVQLYALTNNKSEVARRLGYHIRTVTKHLREATPKEIAAAREMTVGRLAGKIHEKAEALIDSVTEKDWENGTDKQGKRTGPSLMQKVTAAAILTDKRIALGNFINAAREEASAGTGALVPQDIPGLISSIQNKIKTIDVLRVQFRDENAADLKARADKLLEQAVAELHPVEVEVLDDFDNPKE
jgi:hypothetical protein